MINQKLLVKKGIHKMLSNTVRLAVISVITISLVLADQSSYMDNSQLFKIDDSNSFQNQLQNPSRMDSQANFQSSSTTCDDYWAYLTEFSEVFGVITIPQPQYNLSKIHLIGLIQITLSVAADLPSVSFWFMHAVKFVSLSLLNTYIWLHNLSSLELISGRTKNV